MHEPQITHQAQASIHTELTWEQNSESSLPFLLSCDNVEKKSVLRSLNRFFCSRMHSPRSPARSPLSDTSLPYIHGQAPPCPVLGSHSGACLPTPHCPRSTARSCISAFFVVGWNGNSSHRLVTLPSLSVLSLHILTAEVLEIKEHKTSYTRVPS